jgi:lipoprotein-anchoring transpeptidase ErfK/SrfK
LAAAVLFHIPRDENDNKGETNMRRLVVISNKKSKAIAAAVATALALTSIHLAATARTATLKRQLEQLAVSNQPSAHSQSASASPANQKPGNESVEQQGEKSGLNATPAAPAAESSATPVRKRQLVISIPDRRLAVIDNGLVMKIYPIAVGARSTPSPDGDFVIINRAKDPTYRHGETEVAPGKDNPLGSRWMGLNLKGYGIHGTNVQSSVGKASSHGCFRMRKQDVEELYTLVQVGDTVTVRRERDAMIAQVFAAPGTTAAAVNAQAVKTQAVKAQSVGEFQVAAAAVTATVETAQQ